MGCSGRQNRDKLPKKDLILYVFFLGAKYAEAHFLSEATFINNHFSSFTLKEKHKGNAKKCY
jgi:hypothetical protein